MSQLLAILLGFGLASSTATQLRVAGPLGPGEGLLVVWLGIVIFHRLLYADTFSGPVWLSARIVRIWMLFFGALSGGIIVAQWYGLSADAGGLRDFAALIFVAVLSIVLASVKSKSEFWELAVSSYLVLATVSLVGLLALAGARMAVLVDPWYQLIRFRGWSENPNQMALMLTAMPFLTIWSYARARTRFYKRFLLVSLAVTFIAGALCLSEALYLAWAASFGFCGFLAAVKYYRKPERDPLGAIWKKFTLPTILIASVTAIVLPFALRAMELVGVIYEAGNQGATRLAVWTHGIEAASRSPVLGLGPGAFSGISGPFQNYEAHNTFIDIFTQAGLLGVAAYIMLLIFAGKRFLATRELAFIGAFVALLVFSCFHYVLRHPTFWLTIVLMIRLASLSNHRDPARFVRAA